MTDLPQGARAEVPAPPTPRLSARRLSVTFGRNQVLRDAALDVAAGEIHALIGQNGSGKSTLAKVLTGLYSPDRGAEVAVDGTPMRLPVRPTDARARGVAVVHQSLGLVPEMTVIENMRVGRLRAKRISRRIRWGEERKAATEVFDRLGRHVPPGAIVANLTEEDRATVAIARALQDIPHSGGLIIFDESTRALSRRSLEHFYDMLDDIVRAGTSALLITHRLEEVIEAADRVSVLRDGEVVIGAAVVAGLTEADLARSMLGRAIGEISTGSGHARSDSPPAVEGTGLVGEQLDGVDVRIAPGEILGVTGLADSGYQELPYLLAGATRARAGRLKFSGTTVDLSRYDPAAAMAMGSALVPSDREQAGLALELSVHDNAAIPRTGASGGAVRRVPRAQESADIGPWLDRLQLQPRDPGVPAGLLSGGNQQKVVMAKWLARNPSLLALHEPTQAVDVGAREIIVGAVKEAAAAGCGVLVASGDENELSMLCDRILIFRAGRVATALNGPQEPDDIVLAIFASPADRRPLRGRADRATPSEEAGTDRA